jgi:DNA recombination protein RmuC
VQAAEAPDDAAREECLERFAKNMSDQVTLLAKKGYWAELDGSPDFVVMFVPGDQFLDAALARRSDLLEKAAEQGVILASPSTLIGLLRAVAVGWREKRIEEQARELFELGRELHERAAVAFEKVAGLGDALTRAVRQYNEFVGSYELRLEPTLRKFEEAGVRSGKELPDVSAVGAVVREVERRALPEGAPDTARSEEERTVAVTPLPPGTPATPIKPRVIAFEAKPLETKAGLWGGGAGA